jgi:hypothetical protein
MIRPTLFGEVAEIVDPASCLTTGKGRRDTVVLIQIVETFFFQFPAIRRKGRGMVHYKMNINGRFSTRPGFTIPDT